jgi:type III pantothenate kinase
MILAIDAGNSTTVLGVFDGDELTEHRRLSTVPRRTSDELGFLLAGMLRDAGVDVANQLRGIVIGSVVPPVTEALRRMCVERFGIVPVIVEPGVRTGISLRYDNPRDLGADRIANAVAAQALFGGPAIVVDFGTAISFDVVDRDGRFAGGAIAPGVGTATDALVARAARLPDVEIVTPSTPIGRSTVTALQAGIVHGFAGQVDGIVRTITAELGPGVTTVATGSAPEAVLAACTTIDHHDPWLTLKGLHRIWGQNVDAP